jgi:ABC-type lipoprotein export system ATPase subunit
MISLRNITKEYKLGEQNVLVPIRNLNLDVKSGEFIIIVGRSGTGKSTLLNLTAGLIKPTSGEIFINGKQLASLSDQEISRLRSQNIGFIFQFPSLIPSLSIEENVTMPGVFSSRLNKQGLHSRANELLRSLGLSDKVKVYPRQLSAGEQRRAAIARSIFNQPQILLADEPTSDLDEQTEMDVIELLKDICNTGVTLLMVTHSLQLLRYADRSFKMDNGTLTMIA